MVRLNRSRKGNQTLMYGIAVAVLIIIGIGLGYALAQNSYENKIDTLEGQINALNDSLDARESEIESLNEDIAQKESRITSLEGTAERLRDNLSDYEQEISSLEERNSYLNEEVGRLEGSRDEWRGKYRRANSRLESLRTNYTELNETHVEYKSENSLIIPLVKKIISIKLSLVFPIVLFGLGLKRGIFGINGIIGARKVNDPTGFDRLIQLLMFAYFGFMLLNILLESGLPI